MKLLDALVSLPMKLRALVIALLVANLLVAGWYGGWFDFIVGVQRRTEREPERLEQQVKPQTVRVVPDAQGARRAGADEPKR